ncbi:DNA polymerase III subunit gamma/tau [Wielerella bovis]|uniref:DNA polymerase III subunit gamma/tau n=1 Tax=Wielerella bovis TaxID=2917790 RepID=UPI002018552B|nr:DNA polymerase III subunit gamma/tau [Wielerella bovis]MCG7657694.1 DNA polymerase III subunit gamma/tau [Wielerella bovis]MCG7659915.1 DNA polymerase III subunit gamma/tau [Wielerella bovis]
MTAYQVLARKWRPKTFADLVGQQHVVKALKNALDKGRLHHAYLLTGTRGVGKTTIARILAKSLNCENPTHGEPCGACQSCRDIDAGRFVDLLEIDAASNTGIDNIREVLENAQYAPTVGKYKVYIIDEVHMLSKSAFNAMLKTLEEPPEHVKFILATTDPHKVPITVLSRCLQFVLRNMTAQQVAEHLTHVLKTEQIVYEPAALALLGRAAQGSMRDALSLLDQAIAMGSGSVQERDVRDMIGAVDKRYLYELLTFLMEQDSESLIAKAQEMSANAIGFDSALNDLAMLLQRLALLKTVPSAIEHDDPERERLLHLAQYFSDEQIQLYYQCVIHGKNDLPLAPDEYAGFVMTLLRMLAFAPFAAKHTPQNAVIEGTQLHNPPEKKTHEHAEISGSLKTHSIQIIDEVHSDVNQIITENISSNTEVSGSLKAESSDEIQTDLPKHLRDAEAENLGSLKTEIAAKTIAEVEPNQSHHSEDMPSWDNTATASPQNRQPENVPQIVPAPVAEIYPNDDDIAYFSGSLNDVYPDDFPAFDDLPSELMQPENCAEPDEIAASEEATDPSEPMPELIAANWVQIARRIGAQVAAAQMPLQHMAWVDFADGVLRLAVVREQTRNTMKREYFQRIESALSAAYALPIRIETVDFADGQGWETPLMYRARMLAEQREQARQILEKDENVKQIKKLFNAKWREESVELLEAPKI